MIKAKKNLLWVNKQAWDFKEESSVFKLIDFISEQDKVKFTLVEFLIVCKKFLIEFEKVDVGELKAPCNKIVKLYESKRLITRNKLIQILRKHE